MQDVLTHYQMYDYRARCAVAVTTEITREAQRRHGLDPMTTIAFGRAVSCAALLASTLKIGGEYVHCSYAGLGVLKRVVAECNGEGHCRGYTSPTTIVGDLKPGEPVPQTVGEALVHGVLTVTRGKPGLQQPYSAVCEFMNGEIAADMARFLTESEQIPSAVAAGVKLGPSGEVISAGGVLFQKLGGTILPEQALADVEKRMARSELALSDRLASAASTDALVEYLQGEKTGFGVLSSRNLSFKCTCSRERMGDTLTSLGLAELERIEKEVGKIEVRCTYCATAHLFRLEELTKH